MMLESLLGSFATITSICLNCAPFLEDIPAIQKQRTTGERSPTVFVAIWANACLWIAYGIVAGAFHPISTTNLVGLASGSYFLFIFHRYSPATQKAAFMRSFSAAVSVVTMAYTYAFIFPDTPERTKYRVGLICCIVTVGLYGSPLGTVWKALQLRAPKLMSLPFVVVAALNSGLWTLFGLLKDDPWVYAPNILGAVLALTQLAVYVHLTRHGPKTFYFLPPSNPAGIAGSSAGSGSWGSQALMDASTELV